MLEAQSAGEVSIVSTTDLGCSKANAALSAEGVAFRGTDPIDWETIARVADEERRVFQITRAGAVPIQNFSESTGWVRTLCPTRSAPTVLVSGIPMHRIKETDPIADTQSKMAALGQPKGHVLDTATGLGYTAIFAARTAKEVTTVELDPAGIEIARLNPWSKELFERSNIKQLIGDTDELIDDLPNGYFEDVIHDPPTMTLAGELYSEQFYRKLHRVMKRNGRLFHYVGDPNSGVGKRFYPGIMKRLGQAGFRAIRRKDDAFGVVALS
jgi:predicted methyltransferase